MDIYDFIYDGELIGEGCYKKAYRLGDRVLVTPRFNKSYYRDDVLSQIDIWNRYKGIDSNGILLPILEYSDDIDNPWYVTQYVETVYGKDVQITLTDDDYYFLGGIRLDDVTLDTLDDILIDEFEVDDNIGVLDGKQVIADYSLTGRNQLRRTFCDLIFDCCFIDKTNPNRRRVYNLNGAEECGTIYMYYSIINQEDIATVDYHIEDSLLVVDCIDYYFKELEEETLEGVKFTLKILVNNTLGLTDYILRLNEMDLF